MCEAGRTRRTAFKARASAIGAGALKALASLSECGVSLDLRVGSEALLFRRAADLILGGESLLTVTAGGLRSGFSIVTRSDYPLSFREALGNPPPGSAVTASVFTHPPLLRLERGGHRIEILLDGAEVWSPKCFSMASATRLKRTEAALVIPRLTELLAVMAAACGSCPPKEVLEAVSNALTASGVGPTGVEEFVRRLALSAGAGDGLTPASDDVLLGASVAYECLSRAGVVGAGVLESVVREVGRRTSRLSYLIILESINGGVNEGLDNLVCGVLRGDWETASEGVTDLMMVGSNSGVSMGFGALLTFSIIAYFDSSKIFKMFHNICGYECQS